MSLILSDDETYASTIKGIETRALGAEIVKLSLVAKRKRTAPKLHPSSGDVATIPGRGIFNWKLYGRVLMLRQMELDYPAVADDFVTAIAIERRVRRELYG